MAPTACPPRQSGPAADALLADHSRSRETFLRLALLQPSLSSLLPLSSSTLSALRKAVEVSSKRAVVSLCIPALLPAIRDRTGKERGETFEALQGLLRGLYVALESAKKQLGKVLLVADIFVEGWSRDPALGEGGWERVLTEADADVEGKEPTTREEGGRKGKVALGGTFDHLHAGHKILLTMAAWLAGEDGLVVGITDQALLSKKKHPELLESFLTRSSRVRDFLSIVSPGIPVYLPALQDVYGPTVTDPSISSLVVTTETLSGADAIDKEREKRGMEGALRRWVVGVMSEDEVVLERRPDGQAERKMGSTAIRGWIAERLKEGQERDTAV